MKFLIASFLLFISIPLIAKDLNCYPIASSSVTWDSNKNKWKSSSDVDLSKDEKYSLKLINVGPGVPAARKPALVGNAGTSDLAPVMNANTKWVYAETTSAGNLVIWTVFASSPQNGLSNYILINNKAYDLFGPVTYTTVYSCA